MHLSGNVFYFPVAGTHVLMALNYGKTAEIVLVNQILLNKLQKRM